MVPATPPTSRVAASSAFGHSVSSTPAAWNASIVLSNWSLDMLRRYPAETDGCPQCGISSNPRPGGRPGPCGDCDGQDLCQVAAALERASRCAPMRSSWFPHDGRCYGSVGKCGAHGDVLST